MRRVAVAGAAPPLPQRQTLVSCPQAAPGVDSASVDLDSGIATVLAKATDQYELAFTQAPKLVALVAGAGFSSEVHFGGDEDSEELEPDQ